MIPKCIAAVLAVGKAGERLLWSGGHDVEGIVYLVNGSIQLSNDIVLPFLGLAETLLEADDIRKAISWDWSVGFKTLLTRQLRF